jgi:excisionase family DNA binding protein
VSITEVQQSRPSKLERLLFPINDALEIMGVSRTKLFALIASGEIESVKIGRRRLIPYDSMVRFIERLRAEQAG